MSAYFTAAFWRGAADRAIKSTAHALILVWGVDNFNVLTVNLGVAAGLAGGAAVLSVLTSIVSSGVGTPGTTSMISDAR